jgi:hypothetical protein
MAVDPNAQRSIDEQNVYIRDTLMSIAAKYGEVLKDAVEDAFDSAEASILNSVGKDLTRSFTKLAKASDEFAFNQSRIKKGLLSQKDIEKQINSIQEKREGLERKIEHARRLGLEISEEDYALALESLRVQEEQLENDEKLAKSLSGRISLQKGFNDLQDKFNIKQLKDTFSLAGIFKILIDSSLKFNKISVEIGKNLGYDADSANRVTSELLNTAQSANNVNITLTNAAEAMSQLSESTGYVAEYSADALETQIMLTKQFGLQADEAAGIYKLSVLTGKSSKAVNDAMVGAFVATRNQLKVGVPFKAAIAEAAKVSGQLQANLQANPALITKAVVETKALGTSLEQTAKQGELLLDFESSLENELKAELLTGKQLNLERARAAALTGDQVSLAEELNKNIGTYEDFTKMNVLQQKALAQAVGLTADELANQLKNQKIAQEQGKSLVEITKEEALEAEQRQNIQDKFNQSILKLQDFIGNLVAGPMAGLLDVLTQALDVVTLITMPFKFIYDMTSYIGEVFGGWLDKLGVVGKLLKGIAGAAIIYAAYAAYGSLSAIPVVGPVLGASAAAAITAAGFGLLNSNKADDLMSEGGYGKRTLLAPEGAIRLNDNDTVIAGTNLGGGGMSGGSIDLTPMIAAINEVKIAVNQLMNRPVIITMDSKQVGSSLVQASPKSA